MILSRRAPWLTWEPGERCRVLRCAHCRKWESLSTAEGFTSKLASLERAFIEKHSRCSARAKREKGEGK